MLIAIAAIAMFIILIQMSNFGNINTLNSESEQAKMDESLEKLKFAIELTYLRGHGDPVRVGLRKNYTINITEYGVALSDEYASRRAEVIAKMIAKNITASIVNVSLVEISGDKYINVSPA